MNNQTRISSRPLLIALTVLGSSLLALPAALADQPPTVGQADPAGKDKTGPDAALLQRAAQLEVDKAVSEEKATTAKKNEDKAQTQAQDAKFDLDALKSGRLMQYGLTAGVAAAMQIGLPTSDASQKTVAVTAMPYVLAVPFYWGVPQATRSYCAASWGVGDEAEATAAAQGVAKKTAERMYAAAVPVVKQQLRLEKPDASPVLTPQQKEDARYAIGKQYLLLPRDPADEKELRTTLLMRVRFVEDSVKDDTLRDDAISSITNIIWNPRLQGSCGLGKVGLWLGIPTSYSATTALTEVNATKPTEAKRDVSPKIAFGLAVVPNAYFSVLVGITLATLAQQDVAATADSPANKGVDKTLVAGTVAIGGNLDLLGALAR
jgi:hypothetical protein